MHLDTRTDNQNISAVISLAAEIFEQQLNAALDQSHQDQREDDEAAKQKSAVTGGVNKKNTGGY